ncbi:hypothetical protein ACVXHB_15035 [Escherichia coli]
MSDTTILQNSTHVIKPKKSVALSGVPAGNTALCTVGKSGNDLHYRGYDILIWRNIANLKKWRIC